MSTASQLPRLEFVSCLHPGGLHRMAYWEWGDADNPDVVVCVHGLSRQGRDFDRLARALQSRFRVVCPDMPGRGRSDWLPRAELYQLPLYVADVVTLLARLEARRLAWVGTSMGGLIGIGLAGLEHNPVGALVLNDIGPAIADSGLQRIAGGLAEQTRFASIEQGAAYLAKVSRGFGPHSPEAWLELCRPMLVPDGQAWRMHYDPAIMQAFAEFATAQAEPSRLAGQRALWDLYERIQAPTLLLRGAQSDVLDAGTAQAMRERGPRAQLLEWPEVGHAPTLMCESQIRPVLEFLQHNMPPQ